MGTKERAGRKRTTVTGYRSVIDNHLVPYLGAHHLGDLRPGHVQAMLDRIAAEPSKRPGKGAARTVTSGTLLNIRAILRTALNDAMRQQLVSRNVAALVTIPPVRRPQPVAIDDKRLAKFLDYTARVADPLETLWLMDAVYGLRRAELLGLRWDDIDQLANLIEVRQTLTDAPGDHPCPYCFGTHRRLLFGVPKSLAGERCYPLVPAVAAALVEQRRRQDYDRELYGSDYADHRLVFAQSDGNPWRPAFISREFKRLMKAAGADAGLARVPSLKAMRSTMVTRLHERGLPLEVIAKQTGHAGSDVTREYYLAVTAERTRPKFNAIANKLTAARRSDSRTDPPYSIADAMKGGGSKS